MIFEQALNEYSFDVPHQIWLKKQKNLWLGLVDKGLVNINDAQKFAKFGKFFDVFRRKKIGSRTQQLAEFDETGTEFF